jgi:hypothetical protein
MTNCSRCGNETVKSNLCQPCAASIWLRRSGQAKERHMKATENGKKARREGHALREQHRRSEVHTNQPSLATVRWLEREMPS